MRVDHDKPFDGARYKAVLAATGQRQKPLFLCDITYSAGFFALQDQTDRLLCPGYFDDEEQLCPLVDDPSVLSRIVSLSMLSVYTRCLGWMTEAICAIGGRDATEPFYWK